MKRRVVFTHEAEQQLLASALWWSENRDPEQAARRLDGFESAIANLATHAENCPLIPESERFSEPNRQINYGLGKRPTHRAVFRIRGNMVEVVTIRHLAQGELSPEEV